MKYTLSTTMHKMITFLLAAMSLSLIAEGAITPTANAAPVHEAFVTPYRDAMPPVLVSKEVPAPIQERIPAKPFDDAVWIAGYWAWSLEKSDFVWVCGVWRRPPPDHTWIAGAWVEQSNGSVWSRGFWSRTPLEKLTVITKAPPASIDDQVPASPGKNYFWIPGYWEYSGSSGNYAWLSGKWESLNQSWVLTPACYIWRSSGYVFVPFYWDLPLDQRGRAYSCTEVDSPTVIEPQTIIQNLYGCYPDYINLYCYYWYYYPQWWDVCGCMPPWWGWGDWWSFGWGDMWGLWWWWSHPGAFPPFWISIEINLLIAPPPIIVVDAFADVARPPFPMTPGPDAFLPQGHGGSGTPPRRPHIPNDVTPQGQVTPPRLPGGHVTPPPPPPQPVTPPYTPQPQSPQGSYQPPARPYNPPTYTPPPTYYPPSSQPPQGSYQPPVRPHNPPTYTPPTYNPSTQPRTPTQPYYPGHSNTPSYQTPGQYHGGSATRPYNK